VGTDLQCQWQVQCTSVWQNARLRCKAWCKVKEKVLSAKVQCSRSVEYQCGARYQHKNFNQLCEPVLGYELTGQGMVWSYRCELRVQSPLVYQTICHGQPAGTSQVCFDASCLPWLFILPLLLLFFCPLLNFLLCFVLVLTLFNGYVLQHISFPLFLPLFQLQSLSFAPSQHSTISRFSSASSSPLLLFLLLLISVSHFLYSFSFLLFSTLSIALIFSSISWNIFNR
jgi:hypothetical protein